MIQNTIENLDYMIQFPTEELILESRKDPQSYQAVGDDIISRWKGKRLNRRDEDLLSMIIVIFPGMVFKRNNGYFRARFIGKGKLKLEEVIMDG